MAASMVINQNWDLTEENWAQSFKLSTILDLKIGDVIYIKKADGTGTHQQLTITGISISDLIVSVNDVISETYLKGDIVYKENSLGGITVGNCACLKDDATIRTYVHEFLHMDDVADLKHIPSDNKNLMYPSSGGSTLRYREMNTEVEGKTEEQWEQIHDNF